jgi:tryptophan halogenase
MKKKIAIIGRGTAGVLATAHFSRWASDCEVELYYDENIKPQPVGEGSTLEFPVSLAQTLGFTYNDLHNVDGTFKSGIKKTGWGSGINFVHDFDAPNVSYHFNAGKLQNYIVDKLKDTVKVINKNVTHDTVDADFVLDCSGKPQDYSDSIMSEYIAVNAVHVTQCYWDMPKFNYTLALARPYGWVFGIPLQNRCSIGYMYNHNINTLEEVKEDVKNVFAEYNLTPSQDTNSFHFKNYYKKNNFAGRVAFNGNASFFLEPLEATSIGFMEFICRNAFDVWFQGKDVGMANTGYLDYVQSTENMIMLHYYAGSVYDTPFWDYAKLRGANNIEQAIKNKPAFTQIIEASKIDFRDTLRIPGTYGQWSTSSYKKNLTGLNLYNKLKELTC